MNSDVSAIEQRIEDRINGGLLGRWYVVAKSGDVAAGKPYPLQALGRELVLWRDIDGALRCVEDRCPHRGARLSLGEVFEGNLACRYHGVTVDGFGRIVRVPTAGRCGLEGRKALEAYAVREAHDGVFVYFPSAAQPEPVDPVLPEELTSDAYAGFLCMSPWNCGYRPVLENLVDPMHGIYLHGDTFTLSEGRKQDKVEIEPSEGGFERGFIVKRAAQQGTNVDWAQIVLEPQITYSRVLIPYPLAGGPGGPMMVIAFVTPVDPTSCRIYFWRTRKVEGVAREAWRFLFRALFEPRHWYVLEQDREMIASIRKNAGARELLHQSDIGVARIRRVLAEKAREQVEREAVVAPQGAGGDARI